MIGILYFVVIIFANTVGAISGMGGGVIIKPVLDAVGADPLVAITFYSSVAVLTMSIVSTLRQRKNSIQIRWDAAIVVSIGAIVGGSSGNISFEKLLDYFGDEQMVQLIQVILTVITLIFALIYSKMRGVNFSLKNKIWFFLVGLLLGFLASLLGIGGGPINVALLMLCFDLPIKEATVYSLITIFFSQFAKLFMIMITTGFDRYDLSRLWFIIPAAILGGYFGAKLSGILSDEKVRAVYQEVIVLVILLNLYNGYQLF